MSGPLVEKDFLCFDSRKQPPPLATTKSSYFGWLLYSLEVQLLYPSKLLQESLYLNGYHCRISVRGS